MHKWNIDIILKSSGVLLHCIYDGPENSSGDVMWKLFSGKNNNDMIGLAGNSENSNMFVQAGEIAAVDIYERKSKK